MYGEYKNPKLIIYVYKYITGFHKCLGKPQKKILH